MIVPRSAPGPWAKAASRASFCRARVGLRAGGNGTRKTQNKTESDPERIEMEPEPTKIESERPPQRTRTDRNGTRTEAPAPGRAPGAAPPRGRPPRAGPLVCCCFVMITVITANILLLLIIIIMMIMIITIIIIIISRAIMTHRDFHISIRQSSRASREIRPCVCSSLIVHEANVTRPLQKKTSLAPCVPAGPRFRSSRAAKIQATMTIKENG